jgi:nucleotide-binding universal stress UspA family protein
VLESAVHRLPFQTKLETQRLDVRAARTITNTKKQLAVLKLKGTVYKEQGAVAPVILKRTPKRDGLLVVGSQGLAALDRFILGSVATRVVQHTCCAEVVVDDRVRNHRGVPCSFSCN